MNKTWAVILSIVLTALLVGGGVYYFTNYQAKVQKEDLNMQIENLQSQVENLQTQVQSDSQEAEVEKDKATGQEAMEESTNEGWKVYENDVLGVKFEYPNDWKPAKSASAEVSFLSPNVKNGSEGLESGNIVNLNFIDGSYYGDVGFGRLYFNTYFNANEEGEADYEVERFNGNKAYQTHFGRMRVGQPSLDTCFPKKTSYTMYHGQQYWKNNKAYYCLALAYGKDHATKEQLNVYNKMLDTFEFTD